MIYEFWQENLEVYLDLLSRKGFSPQEIGRYRSMSKKLIENGKDGTWDSYDDAEKYYRERIDLSEKTRYRYYNIINKLKNVYPNQIPVKESWIL